MKRTLLALITLSLTISTTMAMNFDEAFKQSGSKPMALLLYADWADNAQQISQAFSAAEPAPSGLRILVGKSPSSIIALLASFSVSASI